MITIATTVACVFLSAQAVPPPSDWPADLPPVAATPLEETPEQHDMRMAWWRESRFGLFIHWGLYAIPAGHWDGRRTGGAEWILNSVRIHPNDYMPLKDQFNPVDFDPTQWAMIAKNAGMKYLVITSKHHDGFCLWPSALTMFDVESTPFKRDILGELTEACRREGIVLCFYHSIMDWTHPDYLPRRSWDDRPFDPASYSTYSAHMRAQVDELLDRYQPAVLWFDGEWEGTWTHEAGVELYDHIRTRAPWIIVNNRVDTGRSGMAGLTREGGYRGDFGTPEQQIPATGMPAGVDWETCMTMNHSWGWQTFDDNWKSNQDLIRKLVDIASKGGNFLLNVGPMANGEFPPAAVERLAAMGKWMDVNGASIHGTDGSPFKDLSFGRCTSAPLPNGNQRLYLHVFDRPADGELRLEGLMNAPLDAGAYLLADPSAGALAVRREDASLLVRLPETLSDAIDTVVVLDLEGEAIVVTAPIVSPASGALFIDTLEINLHSPSDDVSIRYELDGTTPSASSPLARNPIQLDRSCTVTACCFLGETLVSPLASAHFEQVVARRSVQTIHARPGLHCEVYLGSFDVVPNFKAMKPDEEGTVKEIGLAMQPRDENFAMQFSGFINVPETAVWHFALDSDDGSAFWIGQTMVIDNDGLHSAKRLEGSIALEKGLHPIRIGFFEKAGQDDLLLEWGRSASATRAVEPAALIH